MKDDDDARGEHDEASEEHAQRVKSPRDAELEVEHAERAKSPHDAELEVEHAELQRLLLRSAKVDVAPVSSRERSLRVGLVMLSERRRQRRRVFLGGVAGMCATAAAITLFAHRPAHRPEVVAERIRTVARAPVPAPSASALPSTPPPCSALVVARGDAPLIEDFEQEDARVLEADGRKGAWMTYDDGTGTQSPPNRSALFPSRIPGGRGQSKRALHMAGGKFTNWGVTFGTELADAACYDASAYGGIEFWAKGPGEVRIGLQMIDVQAVKYGGFCQADCYDTHRKIVELASGFRKYVVRWDELEQLYVAGPPVTFDPRRVRFLEFGIAPERTPFDVWIDDVSFTPR